MKKMIRMDLYRIKNEIDRTIGKLYIDGVYFGYTMEDVTRPDGVKVQDHTAIPEGVYEVVISWSEKYQQFMAEIIGVPGFTGIRFHGGNHPDDTRGCVLVAVNAWETLVKALGGNVTTIQGSLKNPFNALVRKYKTWKGKKEETVEIRDIYIHIHNLKQ